MQFKPLLPESNQSPHLDANENYCFRRNSSCPIHKNFFTVPPKGHGRNAFSAGSALLGICFCDLWYVIAHVDADRIDDRRSFDSSFNALSGGWAILSVDVCFAVSVWGSLLIF